MGVKGLWELVAPVGRRVSMDTVANKTLAVDVSIWLTQFLYAMRDSDGELIRNAHLLGVLRRCCKLIFYNVKPIFVFDGATPQLKRRTLSLRRSQRNKQKLRLRRIAEKIVLNELKLKKLKEKKAKEPEEAEESSVTSHIDSSNLYDQYMDRVLKEGLKSNKPDSEGNDDQIGEQPDTNESDSNFEQQITDSVGGDADDSETKIKGSEQLEENRDEGEGQVSDSMQSVDSYSSENEEYEVPDISQMNPEAFASMPPEMFEEIVSKIRNRERRIHREEFLKVENDPTDFSQKQLDGFLRLSLTKREVMKARAAASSQLGFGRRRIASDPGKKYSLTRIDDSMAENGDGPELSGSGDPNYLGENNNNKVDEGLEWTKLVSPTEKQEMHSLNPWKTELEPSMTCSGDFSEENAEEDIQWVACPLETDDSLTQQESTWNEQLSTMGIQHQGNSSSCDFTTSPKEDNTEEDDSLTMDFQSAIYSSLLQEKEHSKQENESVQSPQNVADSVSKVDVLNSVETKEDFKMIEERNDQGSDNEHTLDSEKGIRSQVCEENISYSSPTNTTESHLEEQFLNEEELNTGAFNDVILPDEKLEDLFQKFEKERKDLNKEFAHAKSGSDIISDEMLEEIRSLLRILGIPYIQAPMEAEAQCAYFNQVGLVEGVVTEDSDAFLFGARTVFRNIFEDKKYVEQYEMDDIERYLGFDREKLILLSLLLGSDYTQGIHGVGVVNATEIIRAFPTFEELQEFAQWANQLTLDDESYYSCNPEDPNFVKNEFFQKHRKMKRNWVIHDSFPNKHVIDAYHHPMVDTNAIEFRCQRPNISQLVEFCRAKFGWDSEKVKKLILPVLKAYDANASQTRIEHYFHPMRFAKIKSKRLESALRGITRTVDEEMFFPNTTLPVVKDDDENTFTKAEETKKKNKKRRKRTRRDKAS